MPAIVTIALPVSALIATGAFAARSKPLDEKSTVTFNPSVLLSSLPAVLSRATVSVLLANRSVGPD